MLFGAFPANNFYAFKTFLTMRVIHSLYEKQKSSSRASAKNTGAYHISPLPTIHCTIMIESPVICVNDVLICRRNVKGVLLLHYLEVYSAIYKPETRLIMKYRLGRTLAIDQKNAG